MEPAAAQALQAIVMRENRSILTYVGDAFPWTTVRDSNSLDRLRGLVRAETQAVADIGRLLQRQHVPPLAFGSYPASFTTINFLSLKHILPRLAAFERESIAILEREAPGVTAADAHLAVEHL